MSIVIPLSTVPAERLKAQADLGLFPWNDLDDARPMVEAACAESGDNAERETELILLALQANVQGALRRALDRNPDSRMERILTGVADYYGGLKTIASRVTPPEARWSVDTLAAIANLIPTSSIGAGSGAAAAAAAVPPVAARQSPSSAGSQAAPSSPPPPLPQSAPPSASFAAQTAASSAPPWAQASPGGAATASVNAPVAPHATTSLPAPPGSGIAAGAGVPAERPSATPEAWKLKATPRSDKSNSVPVSPQAMRRVWLVIGLLVLALVSAAFVPTLLSQHNAAPGTAKPQSQTQPIKTTTITP